MGGEGRKDSHAEKTGLYSQNSTCASMQNCVCLNIKKLIVSVHRRIFI